MKRAVILDVDGTLIDTNATHLAAWQYSFHKHGYQVAPARIWSEMGKGGDQLVPSILGEAEDAKHGAALRATESKRYLELTAATRYAVFRGVPELFAQLRRRGIATAIATSSDGSMLEATETSAGFFLEPLADVVVTKSEAPASKPEPDLVDAAVERLGIRAAECLMVGDTEHDGTAAAGARVDFVGLTCGGNPRHLLLQAGAVAVFEDPLELANHLDALLAR